VDFGGAVKEMLRVATYFGAIILAFGVIIAPASAGICASTTDCTLTLYQTDSGFSSNGVSQDGNFGTVELSLNNNVVTVDVDLASGFQIINRGIGFADSLGGGLTIGNFKYSDHIPTHFYHGAVSDSTNDQNFGAFGHSNDVAGTHGPHAGSWFATNELSFTVSDGSKLTDVSQLVNAFTPGNGGTAFFVVNAFDSNSGGLLGGRTGLLAVTGATNVVPEPRGLVFVLLPLFSLAGWFVYRRRTSRTQSAL
jgi:hypothetical protein